MDKYFNIYINHSVTPAEKAELQNALRDQGRLDKEAQLEASKLSREMTEAKVKIRTTITPQILTHKKNIQMFKDKIEHLQTVGLSQAEAAKREYEEKQEAYLQEKAEAEQEALTLKNDSEQFKHGADSLKVELNELEDKDRDLVYRLSMFLDFLFLIPAYELRIGME